MAGGAESANARVRRVLSNRPRDDRAEFYFHDDVSRHQKNMLTAKSTVRGGALADKKQASSFEWG